MEHHFQPLPVSPPRHHKALCFLNTGNKAAADWLCRRARFSSHRLVCGGSELDETFPELTRGGAVDSP